MQYYDLSQSIENDMIVYPGDPKPAINPAKGVPPPWRVSEIYFSTHTGTHIDAASHYVEKGMTIDQYPLERFLNTGVVVLLDGLEPDQAIEIKHIDKYLGMVPKGGVIALNTGWDRYWGKKLYLRHPYLSPGAAESLSLAGIGMVGIDALNVDSTYQETRHAHDILLGQNILIVENLRGLTQLQPGELYRFAFLPLALRGLDGSPVRAVAWKELPSD